MGLFSHMVVIRDFQQEVISLCSTWEGKEEESGSNSHAWTKQPQLEMQQELRTEAGAQLIRYWLGELLTFPLRAGLGSTPGVGLSCRWASVASAQGWAWIQGKTPGRWPSTTHTKVLVAPSPVCFCLFVFFHNFIPFCKLFLLPEIPKPRLLGLLILQDPVQKASPLWSPSWLLTLHLVSSCFSLYVSLPN